MSAEKRKKLSAAEKKALIKKGIRDFFKWDVHYERGFLIALIFLMFLITFTASVDSGLALSYYHGTTLYGVLWTWLNPFYWTQLLYKVSLLFIQIPVLAVQYWLMKKGKISKFMFYAIFAQSILWRDWQEFYDITVTMFAPFASINPLFTLLLVFQKLPLGWSFPNITANPHWQCDFGKGLPYPECYGLGNRITSMFTPTWNYRIDYWMIGFWVIYPILVWMNRRGWLNRPKVFARKLFRRIRHD
jgi:hypothetical protein